MSQSFITIAFKLSYDEKFGMDECARNNYGVTLNIHWSPYFGRSYFVFPPCLPHELYRASPPDHTIAHLKFLFSMSSIFPNSSLAHMKNQPGSKESILSQNETRTYKLVYLIGLKPCYSKIPTYSSFKIRIT